ncbi:MAG: exonuclease SbcCD subunit D [Hydrogenibacillus schlegelii]|uniref:Nuclease SbcCD subunit D n=1 Tax=Hydrogenibacillus schlegelii TaxID=1484 RepID=A0A947D193_HYDSH|nr:exonuclease SbcCD subunit D [Hydrogenibacillus schlegelii]
MRILHTADWHLGKTLEGRSRQDEFEAMVDEMAAIVREEAVDVVLLAGDVFDAPNPTAWAEALFFEALARLSEDGRLVVVIAGNHDQPERLAAARPLIVGSHRHILLIGPLDADGAAAGEPDAGAGAAAAGGRPAARREAGRERQSGLDESAGRAETERFRPLSLVVPRTGERLVVAALPFPSERRLGTLFSADPAAEAMQDAYDRRVRALLQGMAGAFRPDAVNVVLTHLFVAGGETSDSEQPIQLGGAYTVRPESFPVAHYVALGHLHRPQWVAGAPAPVRYAGAPLQLGFSEAGFAKSATVLELRPGAPVPAPEGRPGAGGGQVKEVFLSSGRPLVRWRAEGGLAPVWRRIERGDDPTAWIELELALPSGADLPGEEEIRRLRAARPGIVGIRFAIAPVGPAAGAVRLRELPWDERFRRFYREKTGAEPGEELVKLFLAYLNELETEEDGDAAASAGI